MRRSALWLSVVLSGLGGCAQIFGFDDLAERMPDAGSTPPAASSSGPAPAPTGSTTPVSPVASFHVSPAGDDTADGTPSAPLRSLEEAVRRASAAVELVPAERQTVAMCAGDYQEPPLVIRGPITVRGNYDCATWSRTELRVVGAGVEDVSATRIQERGRQDFVISAEGELGNAPELEALTFETSQVGAPLALGSYTVARTLTARNASLPTFGVSGLTAAAYVGGTGVLVEHCNLTVRHPWPTDAPVPTSLPWTAVGLVVSGNAQRVVQSFVNIEQIAGACQGIAVLEGSLAATENRMLLSGCARFDANAISATGISSNDSTLQSTRNAFQFESPGTFDATIPAVVAGIASVGQGALSSDGDRFVGPSTARVGSASTRVQIFGVFSNGPPFNRVVNASIWLRQGLFDLFGSAAVRFEMPTRGLVAHNTVYLESRNAPAADAAAPAVAFVFSEAPKAGALAFDRNLVIGANPTHRGVRASCSAPPFDTVEYNRYAGFQRKVAGAGCALDADWSDLQLAPDATNAELACDGGCASWLTRLSESVLQNGFRVAGDCAQLSVPAATYGLDAADAGDAGDASDLTVRIDGTGAPRPDDFTSVGAVHVDCP